MFYTKFKLSADLTVIEKIIMIWGFILGHCHKRLAEMYILLLFYIEVHQ